MCGVILLKAPMCSKKCSKNFTRKTLFRETACRPLISKAAKTRVREGRLLADAKEAHTTGFLFWADLSHHCIVGCSHDNRSRRPFPIQVCLWGTNYLTDTRLTAPPLSTPTPNSLVSLSVFSWYPFLLEWPQTQALCPYSWSSAWPTKMPLVQEPCTSTEPCMWPPGALAWEAPIVETEWTVTSTTTSSKEKKLAWDFSLLFRAKTKQLLHFFPAHWTQWIK